jgi:hypothetical protein
MLKVLVYAGAAYTITPPVTVTWNGARGTNVISKFAVVTVFVARPITQ